MSYVWKELGLPMLSCNYHETAPAATTVCLCRGELGLSVEIEGSVANFC